MTIAVHALPPHTAIDCDARRTLSESKATSVKAQITLNYQHKAHYDVPLKRIAHQMS